MSTELTNLYAQARRFIASAKAPATRAAYRSDWADFTRWCTDNGVSYLPATPETVALYLTALAATHKPATLNRRLTSINKAHQAAGLDAPARMEKAVVGETLKGIRRSLGTAQKGKTPLFTVDIQRIIEAMPESLQGIRDTALLLIGFAGGFRRSELAAMRVEDMRDKEDGLVITLPFSKTDQEGKGRQVGIPYGSARETCPVRAYRLWMSRARITEGPVWRKIDRHGNLGGAGLHKDSIGMIVKRAAEAAGLDANLYAGHSLRAGLATQAYMNGAHDIAIMRQTGHRSLAMVRRYIREVEIFRDNAAGKLGL